MSGYTLAMVDELEAAIASGALTVKYSNSLGHKEVTYRSLDEMERILNKMKIALGLISRQSRRILTTYDKGLECDE